MGGEVRLLAIAKKAELALKLVSDVKKIGFEESNGSLFAEW